LQHQAGRWLFEAGYSHNKTSNIAVGWNQNLPSFQLWQQLQAPQFDASGRPVDTLPWNLQVPNPFYRLPGVTGGSIGSSKTQHRAHLRSPIRARPEVWQLCLALGRFTDRRLAARWHLQIQSGVPAVFGTNSFFTGNDVALPHDKQSLNEWFDTTQFAAFPSKTTEISNYPSWTGVQNLPGANYKPAPGDSIKNGVYQDFANFVRYYPTRWSDVRASRVNSVDIGVRKTLRLTGQTHLELRIDAFNALNHPRFGAPNTDPGSANFGRVTPAQENQSRSVELAGKLFF
jgi:hypothetical protein